ncbi:hypothetical protein EV2_013404 [Malus domestica]|uniref:uncharacterized protein n=1 Tax=Malus domestica TaxID=3750 RepID=UPI003974DF08
MEEDGDDDHRRQRASYSLHVMEVVGQIAKPRSATNFDRKREIRGLFPEQKIMVALRMLASGAYADQVDEIVRMGKTTVLESLIWFCSAIEALYTNEYLRKPTPKDMRRLLRNGAQNDLNIFAQSPLFDELLQGKSPRCTYWVNGHKCKGLYYLADGIYPRVATRMFNVEALRSIMMTCIILHNIVVEDEYDYDVIDEHEPDPMNNSRACIY